MPKISVILPVYNSAIYLKESIESILNQTYKDFELIISYDKSKDDSLKIINFFMKKDKRIKLCYGENRGLIESLNDAIKMADCEYIARMDADDISLAQRFENQVKFMEENPEVGICGSAVISFGKNIKERVWRLSTEDKTLKTELLFSSCFAHPTVIMRKKLIDKYNLYYSKDFIHAEDFELWTRFSNYCKFANLKEPLLKYRIVENSASRKADKDEENRYKIIKQIFSKSLEKLNIKNKEEENRLHFNLTVNHRIKNINNSNNIYNYFEKLINTNKTYNIYDDLILKKILGKKWLWYIYYYKKDFKAYFSKYFLYGLIGLKK